MTTNEKGFKNILDKHISFRFLKQCRVVKLLLRIKANIEAVNAEL
jgi:hypothetical protein